MKHHPRILSELVYRAADGHTYWRTRAGWMGAPTFRDGSPDFDNAGHVEDFDLEPAELAALVAELDASEPPRDRDAWRSEFSAYRWEG